MSRTFASGPGRHDENVEIVGNVLAPKGFGRRRTIGGVAAPRRCKGIAFAASPSRLPRGAPNDGNGISDSGH